MKKLLILLLLSSSCYSASWECVSRMVTCHTWRMAVPNGWVVASDNSASDLSNNENDLFTGK